MKVLDMPKPIELTGKQGIYTNVNILEEITGRTRLKVAELMQSCDYDNFERIGLSRVKQKRVSGLEVVQRHSKLMVLGKPGAGKTTFLQYLAMQCIEGRFQASRVPLFITLKDFAEAPKKPDIFKFIVQLLSTYGVTHTSAAVEKLLKQGKALVLLDGLDEVREEDTKRVLRQIREFSDLFHTNQFVITCRIAAKEYTYQSFTEVEMADFDEKQIAIFAQNWFQLTDPVKSQRFIEKLKENKPIQELASSPLLLTLLCLVFGDSGDFPANRSELYQEGLDVLLKKWDAKRNIEREQAYKNLSLQRKEDLLSQIGLTTFEQKDYFFKQKTTEVYIADFIRNLRDADTDPEVLKLDSEAVLKSIEAQHGLLIERAKGIYSFSHLTFHEYFAAREVVANSAWQNLVERITEKRWREVFLLTAGMMRKADDLVWMMKIQIDKVLAQDKKIQQFLVWVNEKTSSVKTTYKLAAVRASYFIFTNEIMYDFTLYGFKDMSRKIYSKLAVQIDQRLIQNFEANEINIDGLMLFLISRSLDINFYHENLYQLLGEISNLDFRQQIREIQNELPTLSQDKEVLSEWIVTDKDIWVEKFRSVIIKNRNIGHDWQFSNIQKKLLKQYYDANQLLVDCLNSDCYISREVRQEIEDTLFLPIKS
ncbi:NACHT domain-containing protein [Nostoc sp.]|uniref:NACHT domain-containing protein n=1 Tax=Nostoc sp. TaxID=1180 RepID=UPI002FF4C96E